MTESLGTILTAMVTPFDASLEVDHEGLAALAADLLDNGSDGLVVEQIVATTLHGLVVEAVGVARVGIRLAVACPGAAATAHVAIATDAAETA